MELELRVTQQEMELNSKNIFCQESKFEIEALKEKVQMLEDEKIEIEQNFDMSVAPSQKIQNLGTELSDYFDRNFKDESLVDISNSAGSRNLEKMIEFDKSIKKLRKDITNSDKDLNERNNSLRKELDKLRLE